MNEPSPKQPIVLSIGTKYVFAPQAQLGAPINFRDYDIILCSLSFLGATLGKGLQDPKQLVAKIIAELDKLKAYVETGRIAVVWPAPRHSIFGPGTDDWLPISGRLRKFPLPVSVVPNIGQNITPAAPELASIFASIENGLSYATCYDPESHIPLAYADAEKPNCVASGFVTENNGVVLCLPELNPNYGAQLGTAILGFAEYLRRNFGPHRPPLPTWASALMMPKEVPLKDAIVDVKAQLSALGEKLTATEKQLSDIEDRKQLFAGQGNALRDQVAWVLRTLGFEVTTHDGNRVDITAAYDGVPFVIEAKGKKGSAGENDVAQLMKWDQEYFDAHKAMPQCLLVVNAFCETPLLGRIASPDCRAFPDNVVKFAGRRNYRLATGLQLFNMAHEAEANPARKKEIAELFLSGPTEIQGFTDMPAFAVP
ncbi:MAG: hypothetical protein ACKVP5_17915 [Aestuariivirga sp.]